MYSDPPNTGLSGFQMVIFRTLLKSGFQMVLAAILLKTIRKPDRTFLTASLDGFGMKKIFFMTLFFIKRSRLATGQNGPVFKCPGLA
jgi:hypothetical protein